MESLCRLMADSHVVKIAKNLRNLKTHLALTKHIPIHYIYYILVTTEYIYAYIQVFCYKRCMYVFLIKVRKA